MENNENIHTNTITSEINEANLKFWCFSCEKEFSKKVLPDSEVFCPDCQCISAVIEPDNDPRSFEIYDAQKENVNNTQDNTTQSSNTSTNNVTGAQNTSNQGNGSAISGPGPQVFSQVINGPSGSFFVQSFNTTFPNANNANAPQNNPFNMMNNIFSGMFQGMPFGGFNPAMSMGMFGDLDSRIIEEFLRNDPNVHGPPPAAKESIDKLKRIIYNSETCKFKDCTVCQEDYKDKDVVNILPCDHTFHKNCVNEWLTRHNSCPICRKPLSNQNKDYDGLA